MAEDFLENRPLPDDVSALREARISLEEIVPCTHTAEQLWPYFSQVDLYNRAGGSSPVVYEVTPMPDSASLVCGTARKLGLTMRYYELPYEWHQPHFVRAEMFFEKGPFRYSCIQGEHLRKRSAVRYRIDYVPRRRFGIAGLLARVILKKFVAVFRSIDDRLPESFSDPLGVKGFEDRSKASLRRAEALADQWRRLAVDAVVPKALAEFICTAPDTQVGRMRPYGLANQLGTSRTETLQFCCRAVREGYLEMSWDLICPSCGGAKSRSATLAALGKAAHCDVCNIRYDADLARNVELSFRPRPDVRRLDEEEYCLQSPSHQRQILVQLNLEPGATERVNLALSPGHYRLRCIGGAGEASFECAYGRPRREVTLDIGTRVEAIEVECGSALDLVLTNGSPHWRTIRFEHHGYREDAATAAEVLELPEFCEAFDGDDSPPVPDIITGREPGHDD